MSVIRSTMPDSVLLSCLNLYCCWYQNFAIFKYWLNFLLTHATNFLIELVAVRSTCNYWIEMSHHPQKLIPSPILSCNRQLSCQSLLTFRFLCDMLLRGGKEISKSCARWEPFLEKLLLRLFYIYNNVGNYCMIFCLNVDNSVQAVTDSLTSPNSWWLNKFFLSCFCCNNQCR